VDIVRLLLKHGAKVEETNENGHTPLVNFSKKKEYFSYIWFSV
jgi:ankyrin repeat protein